MNTTKPRFLLPTLLLVPLLSGCWGFTTHSYPEDKQPIQMSRFAALRTFASDGKASYKDGSQHLYMDRVHTTRHSFQFITGMWFTDDPALCRYAQTPDPELRTIWWPLYWLFPIPMGQRLAVRCDGDDDVVLVGWSSWGTERHVDAWASLARYRPMSAAEFDAVVERSRGKRIELSEDVRGFKVRAENAVREKKYWEAADLLDQGLTLEPAWAQGHYNLGVICEELGLYDVAIDEMQKYLKLTPRSENARAIQDKIHIWQGKLRTG